jgi:hypothetical protein
MPTYTLTGRITNLKAEPLKGLTIRAFNHQAQAPVMLLGKDSLTDSNGDYIIIFDIENHRANGTPFKGPNIFIRVFERDTILGESLVQRDQKQRISIDLQLDPSGRTFDEMARHVSGLVRVVNGNPGSGVEVQVFDLDLRKEELLGKTTTDRTGHYDLSYTKNLFRNVEKESADLLVKVFAGGALVQSSSILFNAPADARIDLTIDNEDSHLPTEFENITRAVEPLLANVTLVELEEDERFHDISFLSGETGYDTEHIANFALAHRLASTSRIEAPFWYAILKMPVYQNEGQQSMSDRLQIVLRGTALLDALAIRKALSKAFKQNHIAPVEEEKIAAWTEAFVGFLARQAFNNEGGVVLKKCWNMPASLN